MKEIGIELPPGRIMGELGFIDPKNRRTGTVESLEDGEVLTITYDRLLELYFQNPEFGYYLLRLTTERLMQNIWRLEGGVAENRTKLRGSGSGRQSLSLTSGAPVKARSAALRWRRSCPAARPRRRFRPCP